MPAKPPPLLLPSTWLPFSCSIWLPFPTQPTPCRLFTFFLPRSLLLYLPLPQLTTRNRVKQLRTGKMQKGDLEDSISSRRQRSNTFLLSVSMPSSVGPKSTTFCTVHSVKVTKNVSMGHHLHQKFQKNKQTKPKQTPMSREIGV